MWISTKSQYGLRALIEIATAGGDPVPLKNVAQRQEISQHYLEQIAASLRRAGFIRSVRGARGGYRLARPPERITAWEVVQAMEGSLSPVNCLDDPTACGFTGSCATEGLWRRVDTAVHSVLAGTTLNDLLQQASLVQAGRLMQLESAD